jgi:hypothetical protein
VEENHVVTHENDRAWRTAVVMNKPSLLALRYQRTEDSYIYPYKLIRLSSKFIKFRVVKVKLVDLMMLVYNVIARVDSNQIL